MRGVRGLWVLGAALAGCEPNGGDCADRVEAMAENCDDVFCGDPVVDIGVGGSSHEPVEDGQTVQITEGPQGGYHVFVSLQSEQLCPVVFVRPTVTMLADPEVVLFETQRHVQAVRSEPDEPTRQSFWGITAFVPCEYWPRPWRKGAPDICSDAQPGGWMAHVEDFGLRIELEVEDHGGRVAHDMVEVQPVCCTQ